jgi:hypothetical protein
MKGAEGVGEAAEAWLEAGTLPSGASLCPSSMASVVFWGRSVGNTKLLHAY